jgi:hypothetical protein
VCDIIYRFICVVDFMVNVGIQLLSMENKMAIQETPFSASDFPFIRLPIQGINLPLSK